jgi:DNA repair protein RadC
VKANTNTATNGIDMNLENIQDANDYLVKAMTNLNEEQIAQLSLEDYNKILAKIEEIKIPSK